MIPLQRPPSRPPRRRPCEPAPRWPRRAIRPAGDGAPRGL